MPAPADIAVQATGNDPLSLATDVLALLVHAEDLGGARLKGLDRKLDGNLLQAAEAERFEGKAGQELSLATLGRTRAGKVMLVGLGPRKKATAPWPQDLREALRLAAGQAARAAGKAGAATLAIGLPEKEEDEAQAARAAVEGALLGAYTFEHYKTDTRKKARLAGITVAVSGGARSSAVRSAVEMGREVAVSVAWARDLVNLGPADNTPEKLAEAARDLARKAGLACEIHGPDEIAELGMGMFLGVTRGSAEPARLVKVSWTPRGSGARKKPVVLVGKAITFDSGGLSLKPNEGMIHMNTDMAGSAAVLGAMRVVAAMKPDFPVHAVLGACENMPGGRAYKPSDVLVAYSGKTVEITNTDAEGRLVLGDVIAWAAETLKPGAMIDVATLTGACIVGLGPTTAGLLGPDGPVVDGVLAAARTCGEEVWRLPLVESLKEQLKSERADLKNAGDRMGGAITAAHFLHTFAGDAPWAHLDIAGPSHSGKERGYVPKAGTGFAVRTLVEFVRGWKA
jgi:leucyl aminopeptidase